MKSAQPFSILYFSLVAEPQGAAIFALLSLAYLSKWALHRQHVIDEFNHPVRMSFFPAMSIGMILLSIAVLGHYPGISLYLWAIGSAVQLAFTLVILSNWMHHEKFQVQHSNPAWFIPVVGNIIVPLDPAPEDAPVILVLYEDQGEPEEFDALGVDPLLTNDDNRLIRVPFVIGAPAE